MPLQLVIGNKNYSSWSMRPWLALRANNIAFEEIFIPLYTDNKADKERILSFSRAGKVPALIDGDITVWDSLAIIEYIAERFPEAGLWPEDRGSRAHARSISAEMHSGFRPLREHLSMELLERHPGVGVNHPAAAADIKRVDQIWCEARERWGKQAGGPYLFGHFTIADAMYTPVVTRFRTYAAHVDSMCHNYMETILNDPDFLAWEAQAELDPPPEPLPA